MLNQTTKETQSTFVIVNGKILDPFEGKSHVCNMMWQNGRIVGLGYIPEENEDELYVYDAKGAVICPSLIDIKPFSIKHPPVKTQLPGFQIIYVPQVDAQSCLDELDQYLSQSSTAQQDAYSLKALYLTYSKQLIYADNQSKLKQIIALAKRHACCLIAAPEVQASHPVIDSSMATSLGLPSCEAENLFDMMKEVVTCFLNEDGYGLHLGPITSEEQCRYLETLKNQHSHISCFTSLAYTMFDQSCLKGYNQAAKVWPPLHTKADVSFVKQALKDGLIDALVSGSETLSYDEKCQPFMSAGFGLDFSSQLLGFTLKALDGCSQLDWLKRCVLCSSGVLGLKQPSIELGSNLDLWLIKPDSPCKPVKNNGDADPFLLSLLDINSLSGQCLAKIQEGIWELF